MTHDDAAKLLDALLSLKTREEMQAFLEDLCTIQEINSMVQRYDVALLLDQGLTYSQIAEITRASTATISRVNRSLIYGSDGYRLVIARMRDAQEKMTGKKEDV
ncbi:MAG: TrpR YerC/YecD [Clostridia bacterium]|nr:TrpR YerC/YecD [Clostridia bacterium]